MKNDYVKRYEAYLNDVVKHYTNNKTLRNFSGIAKQHKIKTITKEQFFENNLHTCAAPLSTQKVIDVLNNITGEVCEYEKYDFPLNEIVVWEHPNGCRTIAYTQLDDKYLPFILNLKGRKDEEDEVWVLQEADNMSQLTHGMNIVKTTKEDILRYAIAIHNWALWYVHKTSELEDEVYELRGKLRKTEL